MTIQRSLVLVALLAILNHIVGMLLPALVKRLGAPTALFVAAVIFALYHRNLRPGSLIFKTSAGLLYGALALRNRALVSPAVAHTLSWVIVGSL